MVFLYLRSGSRKLLLHSCSCSYSCIWAEAECRFPWLHCIQWTDRKVWSSSFFLMAMTKVWRTSLLYSLWGFYYCLYKTQRKNETEARMEQYRIEKAGMDWHKTSLMAQIVPFTVGMEKWPVKAQVTGCSQFQVLPGLALKTGIQKFLWHPKLKTGIQNTEGLLS